MNPKPNQPMDNLLEGLAQHAKLLSQDERKAELQERGIDIDGFLTEANAIISEHLKAERLAWMEIAGEQQRHAAAQDTTLNSWVGKGQDLILAAFQSLVRSASPQLSTAFRNRKDLSVEDMARILDDFERLKRRADHDTPRDGKK